MLQSARPLQIKQSKFSAKAARLTNPRQLFQIDNSYLPAKVGPASHPMRLLAEIARD
jgi:hypothetical protein